MLKRVAVLVLVSFTVSILASTGLLYASVRSMVKKVSPAIVKIGVTGNPQPKTSRIPQFIGSGTLVTPDGLVLTCSHLFAGGVAKIFVKTDTEQVFNARIVRINYREDLAIIKIDGFGPFPYLKLGGPVSVGQRVAAFGSPLDVQHTASFGYVQNLHYSSRELIVHQALINPGNSGGPLVDMSGHLVGVNIAIMLQSMFQTANGLGLAVNIDKIKAFLAN